MSSWPDEVGAARRRHRRRESYLVVDKIIAAAQADRRQAIHPGYGFLSENEASPQRSRKQASSSSARAHRRSPRWATRSRRRSWRSRPRSTPSPATTTSIETPEAGGRRSRKDIGYPGDDQGQRRRRRQGPARRVQRQGGPRGLRRRAATRRSASFGDDRVFIEKFVEEPRHIEIQVLGDAHGNVRLSQRARVLDPAPPPEGDRGGAVAVHRDARTRKAMGEQAVALAKAVELPERRHGRVRRRHGQRSFYFLEMNTRLQVEHPVTECITGLDLVEQMIRVAAGEKLAFTQAQIAQRRAGRSSAASTPRIRCAASCRAPAA